MGTVEVAQSTEDSFGDFTEDIDAYGTKRSRHPVKRAAVVSFRAPAAKGSSLPHVHVLHTHYDISGLVLEGAVKSYNVLGVAVVHDT